MARAFALGVEAGRAAHLAGLIDESREARPSSPITGLVTRERRLQRQASSSSSRPQRVARLLGELGLDGPYALVERNGEPVERERYGETALEEGDSVVVARPVAGG